MSRTPVPGHQRWLLGAAAVAVVTGALAVVTGVAGLALVAGLASVATGALALSARPSAADPAEAAGVQVDERVRSEAAGERHGGPIPLPAVSEPPAAAVEPAVGPFDPTGLLGEDFFRTTLRGRVAVARRALRPLSLVCFEVLELGDAAGKRHVAPEAVAGVLRATLREADTAGLLEGCCYACILEDTGSDGAVWTAERIRRNLADADPGRRFRAGVASYPNHGLDAAELHAKARAALRAARDWSRDRIEVAAGS